jgi:hypothetical protein
MPAWNMVTLEIHRSFIEHYSGIAYAKLSSFEKIEKGFGSREMIWWERIADLGAGTTLLNFNSGLSLSRGGIAGIRGSRPK